MYLMSQIYGNQWKENIVLSCVPLWKFENEIPIANAGGCLVNYKNTKFILSIAHATIAESEWNIEVGVDHNNIDFGTSHRLPFTLPFP